MMTWPDGCGVIVPGGAQGVYGTSGAGAVFTEDWTCPKCCAFVDVVPWSFMDRGTHAALVEAYGEDYTYSDCFELGATRYYDDNIYPDSPMWHASHGRRGAVGQFERIITCGGPRKCHSYGIAEGGFILNTESTVQFYVSATLSPGVQGVYDVRVYRGTYLDFEAYIAHVDGPSYSDICDPPYGTITWSVYDRTYGLRQITDTPAMVSLVLPPALYSIRFYIDALDERFKAPEFWYVVLK